MTEAWRAAERRVAAALGLRMTVASGNQFNDPGDSTSTDHPLDETFGWMVDSKSTVKGSYSVGLKWLKQWRDRAMDFGRRPLLYIEFQDNSGRPLDDGWVVVQLSDFAELYEEYRKLKGGS